MVSDRLWRTQRAADSKRKKTDGEKAAGSRKKERQPVCQTAERAADRKRKACQTAENAQVRMYGGLRDDS